MHGHCWCWAGEKIMRGIGEVVSGRTPVRGQVVGNWSGAGEFGEAGEVIEARVVGF